MPERLEIFDEERYRLNGERPPAAPELEPPIPYAEPQVEQWNPPNKEVLSVNNQVKLIFHSFRLSQGFEDLQRHALEYISLSHPMYATRREDKKEVVSQIVAITTKMITSGAHMPLGDGDGLGAQKKREEAMQEIVTSSEGAWSMLYTAFATSNSREEDARERIRAELGDRILCRIIERDSAFLVSNPDGKRSRGRDVSSESIHGAQVSHFCTHALQGVSTGCEELDELFTPEAIQKFCEDHGKDEVGQKLDQLISYHNEHSPLHVSRPDPTPEPLEEE